MTNADHGLPVRLPHGSPPEDTGHRIATIRRGERAELRASLVESHDGEPYVRLRAWAVPEGQERGLWPVPGKTLNVLRSPSAPPEARGSASAVSEPMASGNQGDPEKSSNLANCTNQPTFN